MHVQWSWLKKAPKILNSLVLESGQDFTIPHAGLLDTETHATILDSQTASFQCGGVQAITCSFCEKKKQKKQQKTNQP